jgi:integrase
MLTHRAIEALRPEQVAYRVPDSRTMGLAVRVAPSGIKTWDLAFRIRSTGKVKRLSLGRTTDVSLEAVRVRAMDLAMAARTGRDLVAEERAQRAADAARVSVEQLVDEYVRRRVAGRLRTAKEIESRLRRALAPYLSVAANDLRRRDIRVLLDEVAERGFAREAEKRRQSIGAMYRWALSQDIVELDPTAGLSSYGTGQLKDRVLSGEEIRTLWEWLSEPGMLTKPATILQLQILLGSRCGEIGGLRVSEIDTKAWIWTLPALRSKNNKPRVTPLVGIAREIIQERLHTTKGECLFVTEKGAPFTASSVGAFLLNRKNTLPIDKFTTHDLRRTVATMLVEMGTPLDAVAAVIGHEAGGRETRTLVRHYVRTDLLDRKRAILALWDAHVRALIAREAVALVPLSDRLAVA